MQSESGSGGNEYSRVREVPTERHAEWMRLALAEATQMIQERTRTGTEEEERILAWARAEGQVARAKVEMARAEGQLARAKVEMARAKEAMAWGKEAMARAKKEMARTQEQMARAEQMARTQALAQPREWLQARAQAKAQAAARAKVQTAARAEALARALAQAGAAGMVDEIQWLVEQSVTPSLPQAVQSRPPTYTEALADLGIKRIIDTIQPYDRHRFTRALWGHAEHWWFIQIFTPVTRLPFELLQLILYTTIDDASDSPLRLMLVCKHWYTTVTSIWAPLKLGTMTRKLEWNPSLLDVVVDTEFDRGDLTPSEASYEAIFAAIEAAARWRSLVVETFPGQADLPEHLVNRGLQRCSNATMSQLRTFKVKCACEMSPLLGRLLHILGTTASPELTIVEINSANVISFFGPAYSPIFRSVKVLTLDISGSHDPVDLLPHLHQLEELTASHLSLPIYADDIKVPFVNTLRHLTLRAVSVQWMSGRTFDVLESCTISFPLRHHNLPVFRTALPNCKRLTFQGHHLDVLDGISAHKLYHLSVTSGSFYRRGARQLVWSSSQNLGEKRLAPRILHISIEATSQAWMNVLTSMTHLEELVISNARPSSLRARVLQSLIAQPVHASSTGTASTSKKWDGPLCPSLRHFRLKYQRWLRPSEHFDLIPDFLSIISSRQRLNCYLHSFSVWIRSDQQDLFELIGVLGSINQSNVGLLADKSRIKREDLLGILGIDPTSILTVA